MFDKTYLNIPSVIPNNVSVVELTEKRAPTDASVRLLKEMEEKAQEKVIESISIRDCQIECQILKVKDYMSNGMHYMIVYSMNGKKSKVNVKLDDYEIINLGKIGIAETLRSALAVDIATKMICDSFDKVMK